MLPDVSYMVNFYDEKANFLGFETFEKNSQAIQFADTKIKFRIFKKGYYGVHEIEIFGF